MLMLNILLLLVIVGVLSYGIIGLVCSIVNMVRGRE